MRTYDLWSRFRDHFVGLDHTLVPGAPVVLDDPTLLFVSAGMVPFKPYFLGQAPPPYPRAVSLQQCLRTGDIDAVGRLMRYNTFFQMAGSFAFGDYFKTEAITYAWDLLSRPTSEGGLGVDTDRIWVTVYSDDDEAYALWRRIADIAPQRIQRLGRADNLWDMGVPGPCGPSSEIFFDRGPRYGPDGGPAVDTDRFMEMWNLVFMSEIRGPGDGENWDIVGRLPQRNIDTGLGLERTAIVLQEVDTIYETDLLAPMLRRAQELSGRRYGHDRSDDVRLRVVADHIRAAVMLVAAGVTPGTEGRGYVLRRLLRRVVRSMRLLGVDESVLNELSDVVISVMAPMYPELDSERSRIAQTVRAEEEAFASTLVAGTRVFDLAADQVHGRVKAGAGRPTLPGAQAFTLHDTYGFPIDLTLEMAAERGLDVDEAGFRALMDEQRQRARADTARRKTGHGDLSAYRDLLVTGPTEFTGYVGLSTQATVIGLVRAGEAVDRAGPNDEVEVILDRTPFYAESGGQAPDAGHITGDGLDLDVLDVQKLVGGLWVHRVRVSSGEVSLGAAVVASVDPDWRLGARQAHSGTHIVHAALRQVLGPSALQSGSYNRPGYLRLDFAWPSGLSGPTRNEVEAVANLAVRQDLPVRVSQTTLADAQARGALALFGETYGETVRVVEIGGEWSRELCGGTHVTGSAQVGPIEVIGESSVGSGVRRVEAYVGIEAFRHLVTERDLTRRAAALLKATPEDLPRRVSELLDRLRLSQKQVERLQANERKATAAALVAGAEPIGEVGFVSHRRPTGDGLRELAKDVVRTFGERPAVVTLFAPDGDRLSFVIATTAAARGRGLSARDLSVVLGRVLDGRGGGSPELAQGAGSRPDQIPAATAVLRTHLT